MYKVHTFCNRFIENLSNKRREQADINGKNAPVISSSQSSHVISGSVGDLSKTRSHSVPEMRLAAPPAQPFPHSPATRLAAPPAQPFPNTPATAKLFAKPNDVTDEKAPGTFLLLKFVLHLSL